MSDPAISVIIPAFNEEKYLPTYLPTVLASVARWESASGRPAEVIVIDNDSTDATAAVALELGATVITEPVRGIGRARNSGAAQAKGKYLLFVDADVDFPEEGVTAVVAAMDTGTTVGGSIPALYEPTKRATRVLFGMWRGIRAIRGGAQGVTQFCTRSAYDTVGGYRSDRYMSEDVEFFARLTRLGKRTRAPVVSLDHLQVRPSPRRFETWSSWRMIWYTNPVTARLFLNSRRFWRGWYDNTVR
ncbi:glycosyltransferase [Streptomyces sp. NPDC047081]|uniref:glycosyltransferase n=1 Tax=Streptomyces sp. NPDC047081 TaxID=3154706 RepID=UPI003400B96E